MKEMNVKKIFSNKLDKIVMERYGTRKEFIADYDHKFPHPDGKSVESSTKKWFIGSSLPAPQIIYNLSKLLNCDTDYLLTDQEDYRKEYKALAEFTNLSTYAAEELLKYTSLEIEVFNMLIANYGFRSIIQKIVEIASYKNHFGTTEILLSNDPVLGGMDESELKDLKNYATKKSINDLLTVALTNDIYNTLTNIIEHSEYLKQRARREFQETILYKTKNAHRTREELGIPVPKERPKLPGE